jgi:hypothetical protein
MKFSLRVISEHQGSSRKLEYLESFSVSTVRLSVDDGILCVSLFIVFSVCSKNLSTIVRETRLYCGWFRGVVQPEIDTPD